MAAAGLDLEQSVGEAQRAVDAALAVSPEERPRWFAKLDAQAIEKAKTLGIYEVFQEFDLPNDALARAEQWLVLWSKEASKQYFSEMGAESAGDLSYLREVEVEELVESLGLGLPVLKQRKLAEKLLRALVGLRRKAEL